MLFSRSAGGYSWDEADLQRRIAGLSIEELRQRGCLGREQTASSGRGSTKRDSPMSDTRMHPTAAARLRHWRPRVVRIVATGAIDMTNAPIGTTSTFVSYSLDSDLHKAWVRALAGAVACRRYRSGPRSVGRSSWRSASRVHGARDRQSFVRSDCVHAALQDQVGCPRRWCRLQRRHHHGRVTEVPESQKVHSGVEVRRLVRLRTRVARRQDYIDLRDSERYETMD